jgi:phage gp36-like protein
MYCTLENLKSYLTEDSLIQLTDDENLGVIDEARVDEAIANACATIDGYCGRYQLPFVTVPAIIKPIALDLTVYNLYARQMESMPETRKDNRANAIKLLENIAKGLVRLGDALGVEAPATPAATAAVSGPKRLFSRDTMKGC